MAEAVERLSSDPTQRWLRFRASDPDFDLGLARLTKGPTSLQALDRHLFLHSVVSASTEDQPEGLQTSMQAYQMRVGKYGRTAYRILWDEKKGAENILVKRGKSTKIQMGVRMGPQETRELGTLPFFDLSDEERAKGLLIPLLYEIPDPVQDLDQRLDRLRSLVRSAARPLVSGLALVSRVQWTMPMTSNPGFSFKDRLARARAQSEQQPAAQEKVEAEPEHPVAESLKDAS